MISTADILNANILIVDDQETNVQMLEQMLSDAGYQHVTAITDPFAATALHRSNVYDLILLDLVMPGMDGFEVMASLKKINSRSPVPVLVISAQHDQSLRSLDSGAKDFIKKPFDLREVLTRIHNLLEAHLLYKQLDDFSREQESLALHDALTGLPNRRLLMDRLGLAIAHVSRNNFSMAVIYLDLDDFKQVNDTMGHDSGDILLGMVATRLVQAVRKEDTVARLSGDEFVIVLWDLNHNNDVSKLLAKLTRTVSEPYSIKGREVRITSSIGVSIYPLHGDKVEVLMERADTAMYEAKRAGKNSYRIAVHNDLYPHGHAGHQRI